MTGGTKDESDLSRYSFFKYYKGCGKDCDIVIEVEPISTLDSVVSVLVNFENPQDLGSGITKLPTWENSPDWTVSLKRSSIITIEGDEPLFEERNISSSSGIYYIAVHSYDELDFSIKIRT